MTYVPVENLIDGVMCALREDVLPEVASARARGRLWAALDILNNLRDRVEYKAWLLQSEAESARDALAACVGALRNAGRDGDAEALTRAADAELQAANDDLERAAAVRRAIVGALRRLDAMPGNGHTRSARAALESHLASQAVREVMTLKPSLLVEISKG